MPQIFVLANQKRVYLHQLSRLMIGWSHSVNSMAGTAQANIHSKDWGASSEVKIQCKVCFFSIKAKNSEKCTFLFPELNFLKALSMVLTGQHVVTAQIHRICSHLCIYQNGKV